VNIDLGKCLAQTLAHQKLKPGNTVCTPWGRGIGKALALSTKIPTPGGWTTMGALQVGDSVFDETGARCTVTATTDVMHGHSCYLVCFDDGSEIVADAEHEWLTWDKAARKSHGRSGPGRRPGHHPEIRTTEQIFKSLRADHGRETNHSIALAGAIQTPDADLPLDPYVLGYWLGDGTTCNSSITIGDGDAEESLARLVAGGCKRGKRTGSNANAGSYHTGILPKLRELGVLNNKHVPQLYMRGSIEQRKALLAGLLDSDGCCASDGSVEFTSTKFGLAESVRELLVSLGHKARVYSGRATLYGKDCGPKWRVYARPRENVFRLARKGARIRTGAKQANRTSHRYIIDVKPIDSVPVKCIEVDSPSHLYLAGEAMIPTHNSWFMRLCWYLLVYEWDHRFRPGARKPGIRIVLLMPTLEQARKVHAELLEAELEGEWAFLGGKLNKTTWRVTFPGGSWIQWVTAERAQNARGIRCDFVCVDECDDIDPSILDSVVNPWFSEPHSLRMLLVAGTPRRGRKGTLYRYWYTIPKQTPDSAFAFHATAYDAPELVDPGFVEKIRLTTPEPIFKREWLCDIDSAEGLVYATFDERFHVRTPPEDVMWDEILFGADHGWEDPGVILTVGVLGKGNDAIVWVLDEVYAQHKDANWWESKVAERVGWYPDAKWYPDSAQPATAAAWKKIGARVQDVEKFAGSVEAGINEIRRYLSKRTWLDRDGQEQASARLYVHPRCRNTIDEFGLYRHKRDPKNPERMTDEIDTRNDHALDALRYLTVGRFGYTNVPGQRTTSLHTDRE
jgi:hypothetical protein